MFRPCWPTQNISDRAAVVEPKEGWVERRSDSASKTGKSVAADIHGSEILRRAMAYMCAGPTCPWLLRAPHSNLYFLFFPVRKEKIVSALVFWNFFRRFLIPSPSYRIMLKKKIKEVGSYFAILWMHLLLKTLFFHH